jgi:PHD/YefM family antitoxin component YafN of YafNO toxin-antitoxin module
MTVLTATQARSRLYKLLDSAAISHEPNRITGRRNSAILIAEDDWRSIKETFYLLSIPGMRKSIVKGLKTPVSRCSKALIVAWQLAYTKQAQKDAKKLSTSGLRPKAKKYLKY